MYKKLSVYLDVVITAEQEKLRDPEGFAAIKELHRLMDDDQSGSIDRCESANVDFFSYVNIFWGHPDFT